MTEHHQVTADCIRCGRPVEPPYNPTIASVHGREFDGPTCAECLAIPAGDPAFFNDPDCWRGGVPLLEDET